MKYLSICAMVGLVLFSCKSNNTVKPDTIPVALGTYTIKPAFINLPAIVNPVELTSPDDGSNRIFVVSQKGQIQLFSNTAGVSTKTIFLDISGKINSGGEMGLLGLAFKPDYKNNGYFYVNYNRKNPGLETVIARYKVSATDPDIADPNSEEILLTYTQPYENHKGGKLAFGNDKYLYIAAGDGGSAGDPSKNGQNKKQLLGKILRIDVNNVGSNTKYAIPADNPFKGNADGFREEIYAYGMRNPWRFSFDHTTGLLWAGDVGQDKIEEIDIIEKGGNYGWNIMEGDECYNSVTCDKTGLQSPIWSYMHGSPGASVTGGYVCRDKNLPGLAGRYIYGDYVSGNIWALTNADKKAVSNDLIGKVSANTLSSFGEDNNSNLYILNYTDGKIYKLVPAQ
ncbi:sorbosone dehydrogenase family protein [Mucilaginibacter sp. UR6-11]|uniref:PQQ-dependent sugar dehydrogenase n=1 Tax=Mucilaginibacter sp. UR6-11 TaxID=1435644 RepID=UPI001E4FAA01|nr:PQQ-dependent sugar dehydrogenase [Mucilaginibacter sp. UR6-11]MCC8426187.1 PQQ-dependent sugar dehydrogenase [Mucilaginibacter sp. UR6-11]